VNYSYLVVHIYKFRVNSSSCYKTCPANRRATRDRIRCIENRRKDEDNARRLMHLSSFLWHFGTCSPHPKRSGFKGSTYYKTNCRGEGSSFHHLPMVSSVFCTFDVPNTLTTRRGTATLTWRHYQILWACWKTK
jgi:hypothetical protein